MSWNKKPPPAPLVFTGCLKKQAFEEWEAYTAAKKIGNGLVPYRCDDCLKWHLTRNQKTKKELEKAQTEQLALKIQINLEKTASKKYKNHSNTNKEKNADESSLRQSLIRKGLLKESISNE